MTISQIIDLNWDFENPAESEKRFLSLADQHPQGRGRLLTQAARCLGLMGKFEEAKARLDSIESDDEGAELVVRMALEHGRVKNSSGNPSEALPYFQTAFEEGQEAGLEFLAADAAHMLAIASPTEESIQWAIRCIELINTAEDEQVQKWAGPVYNNLAWTYHDADRFEEALPQFEKALEAWTIRGGDRPIQIAKWSVARCLRSLGRFKEALERQLELAIELKAAEVEDGFSQEEIAECLYALDRHDEAVPYFKEAHRLLSEMGWLKDSEPERLARIHKLSTK